MFVLWVQYSSTIFAVGSEFAYSLEEDRQRPVADKLLFHLFSYSFNVCMLHVSRDSKP
jgi:uncharacterized BrkB/YihY/UPF0761 family membrane protein